MLERLHTWMSGWFVGLVFGLLLAIVIVGDQIPPNPNYVETVKSQERLQ